MTEILPDNWIVVAVAAVWVMIVAGLGGWLTEVGPWYESLTFPDWRPPNWLFAPAWTLIFIFIASSCIVAWNAAQGDASRISLIVLLVINSIFNVAWSLLFFKLRRPDWALFEVFLLWTSILALVIFTWRIAPKAGLLMTPYLAWVSFAAYLNYTMVRLNAPFGNAR